MKRLLYLISVVVFAAGLASCNKDDDPTPPPVVVGRWDLNHVRTSGFTSANLNNLTLDLYYLQFYSSRLDVYSDNTFVRNDRQEFAVGDFSGTWTYTNDKLTLKYDDGSADEVYTYTKNKNIEELSSELVNFSLDSTNAGKAQLIYRK
ncbi:lipocalin family protein [Larkinella insperata]|uniref:Lipocalin family protein n=1 Tax=Larkinella insperata TaxID=332158 RepID=A0ABW3Q0B2_9BACT|nr:lipocalin family protein [Larkinella insperata]